MDYIIYARVISAYEHLCGASQGTAFLNFRRVWSHNDLPVQKRLKEKIISNPSEIYHKQETYPMDKDQTRNEEFHFLFLSTVSF